MSLLGRILRRFRSPYYEPAAVKEQRAAFYRPYVASGDLIFDVGANEGSYTEAFLALGAHVVAVDPQEECVRILRHRFAANTDVVIEAIALGATEGEVTLHLTSLRAIASVSPDFIEATRRSGRFAQFEYSARCTVPQSTLDTLIARYGGPALIKIDAEGAEAAILSGLRAHPPSLRAVSFEYVPELHDRADVCLQILTGLGAAKANFSLGESMRFAFPSAMPIAELSQKLHQFRGPDVFGDVFVEWNCG